MQKFHSVTVIMGGTTSEREVSLRSGACIAKGLADGGCDVRSVVIDTDSIDGKIPAGTEAVFIALHGGYGENGGIQADLDRLGIPYTGPGAKASSIAIDKFATKGYFRKAGVLTPRGGVVGEDLALPEGLAFPVAVKPRADGSSVGLTCPCTAAQWRDAVLKAAEMKEGVVAEEYIEGREWTVGIIAGVALPVIEIAPKNGVYDYGSKYTKGATVYTPLDDTPLTRKCQDAAVRAFNAIGARGLSRVDFKVTASGDCYALEVNTVPGFTETSLVPKAAAKAGMTFPETCLRILGTARCGE